MNILFVEDDGRERLLLEEQLTVLKHHVTACEDGATALQAYAQARYALVMMDLGLPDMDGIELCRRIRALPQGKQCMILICTGRDSQQDVEAALEAGANDYLVKPVSISLLKVRLTIIERQAYSVIHRRRTELALKKSIRQIERAKREWESTADTLSHIVCLIDDQQRVLRVNRAIELWNLGKVVAVNGKSLHELFHPRCQGCDLSEFLEQAWLKIPYGRAVQGELYDEHLGRHLRLQLRPIVFDSEYLDEQSESYAVLVVDDVSDTKRLQEALSKQDRLLLGIAGAMNHLLISADFSSAMINALRTLAFAADADRVYIFQTHACPNTGEPLMSQRFRWDQLSGKAEVNDPALQNIPYKNGFGRWYESLSVNETICDALHELPSEEQELLAPQNILSILVAPITIQEQFWGFLGFDDCHAARQWRYEEEAVLTAMAASFGGAIAHEHSEEQLRQTSTELREVFHALPDDYFRLGADGSILDYKIQDGADLFLHTERFIGKWASGLLPEEVEQQFELAIEQVRRAKKLVSIEYRLPASDENQRYEEIRLLPFLQDQLLVVTRDITQRKLAEEELRQHRAHLEVLVQERTSELTKANLRLQQEILNRQKIEEALRESNQRLEDASQHKSQFLARMSHELRTPLNAMIGYTSLTLNALKGTLETKHLDNLGKAEQSAKVLLQLINDVLDFSKIEAGQMDVFLEKIEVAEILEDVEIIAEGLLLEKPVDFVTDINPDLPAVTSDYTKIKQILNNLIGNAVKFTLKGHVTVRAAVSEDRQQVQVDIEDSGAGIPPHRLDAIFEAFKQVDGSINKRYGGTGLGLAITKKFCEMLGITLRVQSEEGVGTTFRLDIPVNSGSEKSHISQDIKGSVADVHTDPCADYQSILLIDDDDMTLDLMEEIFHAHGHLVYTAHSGEEGLALAKAHAPDVILTDLVMDDMDGFDTARGLKQDAATRHIPVIACSAVATEEFHENAAQAGCAGYITKPIEPERLIEQVRKHLCRARQ